MMKNVSPRSTLTALHASRSLPVRPACSMADGVAPASGTAAYTACAASPLSQASSSIGNAPRKRAHHFAAAWLDSGSMGCASSTGGGARCIACAFAALHDRLRWRQGRGRRRIRRWWLIGNGPVVAARGRRLANAAQHARPEPARIAEQPHAEHRRGDDGDGGASRIPARRERDADHHVAALIHQQRDQCEKADRRDAVAAAPDHVGHVHAQLRALAHAFAHGGITMMRP